MALTKTARLELINPYQKYGLKRRPTFNEIVGLISENEKLIKPFPNREATRFRNSPQGSFFDGSDNLDLLKDQQTRILDRQMRENIMRREAQQNGGTLHLMQHQQQSSGSSTPIMSDVLDEGYETPSSATSSIYNVSFARHMEERLRQEQERKEEVHMKHREGLNKLNQTMMRGMMRKGLRGLQEYEESEEELPSLESIESEEELLPADDDLQDEATSSRVRKHKETIYYNSNMSYWKGKDVSVDDLKFQLYIRGAELTEAQEEEMKEFKKKGKGKNFTKKDYLLNIVEGMIKNNKWNTRVEEQLLQQRIKNIFLK